MPLTWKLKPLLKANRLTAYRLAKVSGVSLNTLYRLVNGRSKGARTETLELILSGLYALTGKVYSPSDVLEWTPGGEKSG